MKHNVVALGILLALLAVGCGEPSKPAAPAVGSAPGKSAAPPVSSAKPEAAPEVAAAEEPGAIGSLAPELKGKAWLTADAKAPELKGKVYLVEFWSVL
jgi:hypothetical protein